MSIERNIYGDHALDLISMGCMRPKTRPFLADVLESVAKHWMPAGWEWSVLDMMRGPIFCVESFDPCAAGERFIVRSVTQPRLASPFSPPVFIVNFIGGWSIEATYEEAKAWHATREAPTDLVRERLKRQRSQHFSSP